jgi:hypothetical protein
VYTNAQPNITSVGTLSSLSVTANITAGNVNAGNLLVANYHSGNGSLLTGLVGANVTGQVGNALIAGTVYTNAQPNITSVGTLTSLAVTANITSGNANLGNLVTANFFSGDGGYLSNIQGSNVSGTVYSATTATSAGTVTNASQPNITSLGTLSSLTASGNITAGNIAGGNLVVANYFSGNANLLTNIPAANLVGSIPNANFASYAGVVTTNAQPNITSVGTLSSLTVSGLITATGTGVKVTNIQDSAGTTTITTNYGGQSGSIGVYGSANIGTGGSGGNLSVSGISFLGDVGNVRITGGTANYILQTDGAGNLSWAYNSGGGGGGGTPGGSNTQIQFNDANTFGGDSTLTFNKVTDTLTTVNLVATGANLGSIANLAILGGTANYVMQTNGFGVLTWVPQASASSIQVYDLDDLSGYSDGLSATFALTYNTQSVNIADPFSILVTVDGVVQPAFVYNTDYVFNSLTLALRKGYTIINAGYITFSQPPAQGAQILVRTVAGITNPTSKIYPFNAGELMLSY